MALHGSVSYTFFFGRRKERPASVHFTIGHGESNRIQREQTIFFSLSLHISADLLLLLQVNLHVDWLVHNVMFLLLLLLLLPFGIEYRRRKRR